MSMKTFAPQYSKTELINMISDKLHSQEISHVAHFFSSLMHDVVVKEGGVLPKTTTTVNLLNVEEMMAVLELINSISDYHFQMEECYVGENYTATLVDNSENIVMSSRSYEDEKDAIQELFVMCVKAGYVIESKEENCFCYELGNSKLNSVTSLT